MAADVAHEIGFKVVEFLPDWNRYGKSAGYRRNLDIVAKSEVLIAFWDGQSKGTKHSIDAALKAPHVKRIVIFKPQTVTR